MSSSCECPHPCLLLISVSDGRPSSNASSANSRPSSSRSESRPDSRRSLRSFRSYAQGLNSEHRPSSSCGRKTPLHSTRSPTSMSQYRDSELYTPYAPSTLQPSFHHNRNYLEESQASFDESLQYPELDVNDFAPNEYDAGYFGSRPRSSAGLSSGMRQTPSPLRWAMQDLIESLDTMSPAARFPPSPGEYWAPDGQHDQHPLERRHSWSQFDALPDFQTTDLASEDRYPEDMQPPPRPNYVDKMQARLDRFHNLQFAPHRDNFTSKIDEDRPQSRLSNLSNPRPPSSHSVNKPLPNFPQPPIPPPHHISRHDTSSTTSHSAKYSIFSANTSDYSSASSVSAGSAGSAGSFARKKARQQRQEEEAASQRSSLTVLPKSQSNILALKRRKSYGSSLKKTIGKLLSTSPTKPPPGTVTDHGDKIIEWQNVRRDVNRANTPSPQEREEHCERLEMAEGLELIRPIEILERIIEGDESANGSPILPDETFDISSNIP
jgi:hypothetical protein